MRRTQTTRVWQWRHCMWVLLACVGSIPRSQNAAFGRKEGKVVSLPPLLAPQRSRQRPPPVGLCSARRRFADAEARQCCLLYVHNPSTRIRETWGDMSPQDQQRWAQLKCDSRKADLAVVREKHRRYTLRLADNASAVLTGAETATAAAPPVSASAASCAAARGGEAGSYEATELLQCLEGVTPCLNRTREQCAASAPPRSCLFTRVPPGTPFSRVLCCFACCMGVWIERLGLWQNVLHWMGVREGVQRERSSPFLASNSMYKFSHIAYNYHRRPHGWHRDGEECVADDCELPRAGAIITVNKPLCGRGGKRYGLCNLEYFVRHRLPKLARGTKFTLVTEGDANFPSRAPVALRKALLADERLVGWFVNNVDAGDAPPRVQPIPRGIMPPRDTVVAAMRELERRPARKARLLMCFGMKFRAGDGRREIVDTMQRNGFNCSWPGDRLPTRSFLREMAKSKFVLSPPGHGWSNFRDSETIFVGSVPVLHRRASHASLYAGAPAVLVDDWNIVTPAFLEREWERLERLRAAKCTSVARVYLPFWLGTLSRHIVYDGASGAGDGGGGVD